MVQYGVTPLLAASGERDAKTVALLLEAGADVNATDNVSAACFFIDHAHQRVESLELRQRSRVDS